jgi:hypothetical protein
VHKENSILLLVLIVVIAIVGFKIVVARADRITLQHDLENFVKAQDIFRADNKHYLGKAGDFIEYETPPRVSWLYLIFSSRRQRALWL